MVPPQNAEAGPSTGPHRMRISSGGNIQAYVKFALSFLQNNPDRPLIVHTIPPETKSAEAKDAVTPQSTLHQATLTAPKLISVVELIKRDYIASLETNGAGKHKSRGIWQYTESGLLPVTEREEAEGDELVRVLGGKTKPKMIHRPYLQVTLSSKPLDLEKERNVTCQYLLTRRRKKKGKKGEAAGEDDSEVEVDRGRASTKAAGGSNEEAGAGRNIVSGEKTRPTTKEKTVDQGNKAEKRKSSSSQNEGGKRKKSKGT